MMASWFPFKTSQVAEYYLGTFIRFSKIFVQNILKLFCQNISKLFCQNISKILVHVVKYYLETLIRFSKIFQQCFAKVFPICFLSTTWEHWSGFPKYFEILGHHLRFYLLGDIAEKCHHIIKCNINACRKDKLKTTGDYNYITPKHITFPGCILLPENKKYRSLEFSPQSHLLPHHWIAHINKRYKQSRKERTVHINKQQIGSRK